MFQFNNILYLSSRFSSLFFPLTRGLSWLSHSLLRSFSKLPSHNCRVQMVCGTFLVASLHGDQRLLSAMIQIFKGVEILQVVCNFDTGALVCNHSKHACGTCWNLMLLIIRFSVHIMQDLLLLCPLILTNLLKTQETYIVIIFCTLSRRNAYIVT